MKKAFTNTITMIGFLVFLLLGTVGQNHGAANVAMFFVWVISLASFSYLNDKAIAGLVKDPHPFTPLYITLPLQVAAAIIMAWYGWIWTASVFVVGCLLGGYAREKWKRQRGEIT